MVYLHVFVSNIKNTLFTDVVVYDLDVEFSGANGEGRLNTLL
jgi:hypothetical protein